MAQFGTVRLLCVFICINTDFPMHMMATVTQTVTQTVRCSQVSGYSTVSIAQVYLKKRVSATVSVLEGCVHVTKCIYICVHAVNTKVYTGSSNNK